MTLLAWQYPWAAAAIALIAAGARAVARRTSCCPGSERGGPAPCAGPMLVFHVKRRPRVSRETTPHVRGENPGPVLSVAGLGTGTSGAWRRLPRRPRPRAAAECVPAGARHRRRDAPPLTVQTERLPKRTADPGRGDAVVSSPSRCSRSNARYVTGTSVTSRLPGAVAGPGAAGASARVRARRPCRARRPPRREGRPGPRAPGRSRGAPDRPALISAPCGPVTRTRPPSTATSTRSRPTASSYAHRRRPPAGSGPGVAVIGLQPHRHRLPARDRRRVHPVHHPVPTTGLEEHVPALGPGAVEDDLHLAVGPLLQLVPAAVPEDHRAAAVLAGRDVALEAAVVDRVVLGVHRETVVLGSSGRPFGTAHETSTPSRSSRTSQCRLRAWCSWMTNVSSFPSGSGPDGGTGSGCGGSRIPRYVASGSVPVRSATADPCTATAGPEANRLGSRRAAGTAGAGRDPRRLGDRARPAVAPAAGDRRHGCTGPRPG